MIVARISHALALLVVTAALIYWVRSWRRNPRSGVAAMCQALFWLDLALLIGFFQYQLVELIGVPALQQLVQHLATLVAAYQLGAFTLHLHHDDDTVPRKARPRLVLLVMAEVFLVVCYLLGPLPEGIPVINAQYGDRPWVVEYLVVFDLYLAWALLDVVLSSWRNARHIPGRHLRRGVKLLGIGSAFGLLFVAHKLFYSVATIFVTLPWEEHGAGGIGTFTVLVAVVTIIAGVLVPPIGPRLAARQTLRRIQPLWAALTAAAPQLVFARPHRYSTGLLHNRVVEIRDVLIGPLQPYLLPEVADRARQLGREQGLAGEELRAVAEAAVIAVGLRAFEQGLPVRTEAPVVFTNPDTSEDEDEPLWLSKVAAAFTGSPIVRTVLNEVSEQHERSAEH
ncbi:hypothetical protein M8C13_27865 [Crossiella sp. SN42]|uniref:MAB_1171c family putative transporter n=1 Tax=Crossiella sp. SN42 TaxID=2944808 RepID=UPI00207C46AB|nr:MAB_1171c family putative transporter [Crossiella sp. SN42]MCO1579574.1 hypothetical protein [Crossiella sp. SN42]